MQKKYFLLSSMLSLSALLAKAPVATGEANDKPLGTEVQSSAALSQAAVVTADETSDDAKEQAELEQFVNQLIAREALRPGQDQTYSYAQEQTFAKLKKQFRSAVEEKLLEQFKRQAGFTSAEGEEKKYTLYTKNGDKREITESNFLTEFQGPITKIIESSLETVTNTADAGYNISDDDIPKKIDEMMSTSSALKMVSIIKVPVKMLIKAENPDEMLETIKKQFGKKDTVSLNLNSHPLMPVLLAIENGYTIQPFTIREDFFSKLKVIAPLAHDFLFTAVPGQELIKEYYKENFSPENTLRIQRGKFKQFLGNENSSIDQDEVEDIFAQLNNLYEATFAPLFSFEDGRDMESGKLHAALGTYVEDLEKSAKNGSRSTYIYQTNRLRDIKLWERENFYNHPLAEFNRELVNTFYTFVTLVKEEEIQKQWNKYVEAPSDNKPPVTIDEEKLIPIKEQLAKIKALKENNQISSMLEERKEVQKYLEQHETKLKDAFKPLENLNIFYFGGGEIGNVFWWSQTFKHAALLNGVDHVLDHYLKNTAPFEARKFLNDNETRLKETLPEIEKFINAKLQRKVDQYNAYQQMSSDNFALVTEVLEKKNSQYIEGFTFPDDLEAITSIEKGLNEDKGGIEKIVSEAREKLKDFLEFWFDSNKEYFKKYTVPLHWQYIRGILKDPKHYVQLLGKKDALLEKKKEFEARLSSGDLSDPKFHLKIQTNFGDRYGSDVKHPGSRALIQKRRHERKAELWKIIEDDNGKTDYLQELIEKEFISKDGLFIDLSYYGNRVNLLNTRALPEQLENPKDEIARKVKEILKDEYRVIQGTFGGPFVSTEGYHESSYAKWADRLKKELDIK